MINNTIPSFLKLLESNDIGLHDLNEYYDMHPEAFEEYFKFRSNGDSSLQYYKEIEENIKKRFLQDYVEGWTVEKEKEWFRLSGGTYFGYNRLGYFLGKSYIEYMVRTFGETEALTFWGKNNLRSSVMEWLQK